MSKGFAVHISYRSPRKKYSKSTAKPIIKRLHRKHNKKKRHRRLAT